MYKRQLSLPDQQAYLIACIDDEVANRIHRLVTETTPLFPNQAQIPCCYDVIDSLFEEKIPLRLRRVQFIANKQQDGQDGISWREELRNLADDAAIEDMEIWSEWRLTVIAATVRIALVDILDLSEVDIPAGGFLYPAVGWG